MVLSRDQLLDITRGRRAAPFDRAVESQVSRLRRKLERDPANPKLIATVLHTAAYWLMLALRDVIPRSAPLARAEFATLRLRLLKIGARVVEKATRVRIHFTSACPDAALFRLLAGRLAAAGP